MGFITESNDPAVFAGNSEQLIASHELRRTISEYNHAYARKRFAASEVAMRIGRIHDKVAEYWQSHGEVRITLREE